METILKHWIEGKVIRGDGRGRDLGFPTANLVLEKPEERPTDGIWACWVKLEPSGQLYRGVLHVGPRPTIEGAEASVEVHIIGESSLDLYDKKLWFSPTSYLREVKKFNSLDELTTAVKQDVQQTVALLKNSSPSF
jgi:riboflavin kinase / FMN adenylyltransferase